MIEPPVARYIQELADKQEIRDLFARYCRGIDRLDAEIIRSVYHEDSFDDHGTYKGPGIAFADHVIPGLSRFERTMHFLGNCLIEITGDSAECETYCVAYHRRKDADGSETDFIAGVRYIDRVESRDGGPWLIANRVVVMEWTRFDPVGEQWDAAPHFTMGRRDRTDLVYG